MVSDSIAISEEKMKLMGDKIRVVSCAECITHAIRSIHEERSLGELVKQVVQEAEKKLHEE